MNKKDNLMFATDGLYLDSENCRSPYGSYSVDDIPDRQPINPLRLKDATPLVEKLFRGALYDAESNIVYRNDRRYFTAGKRGSGWIGMIFIRDVSYAGLLGLHDFYPQVMRDSYAYMRDRMLAVGWKNPACHKMEGFDDEIVAQSFDEFKGMGFNTPPFARMTDGMCAVWGMWDLLKKIKAGKDEIRELYEFADHICQWLYDPLFDADDGLYYGQSSFVDIGVHGYPESFGRNPPQRSEPDSPAIYNRALRIKATSTNCLYVLAFTALAEMAETLGLTPEAESWKKRRETLTKSIRTQLRFADGTFAYFKHENGDLEPRQHALATAFAVLSNTIEGKEAADAIRDYPVTEKGVPLHHPFFDNEAGYHNNSSWPFVDAFFMWAREKALGIDDSARHFALLASVYKEGSFHEVTNHLRVGLNGPAQLWSAAPFLGRCQRAKLATEYASSVVSYDLI